MVNQLDYITKRPLLPVITIAKTSGTYTFNSFVSTFDFRVISLTVKPAFDAVGGTFSLNITSSDGSNSGMNTILSNISEGNEVTIWVGKTNASKVKIFLGVIEEITIDESNKNYMSVTLGGPDWGSDLLKNRVVNYQWDQKRDSSGVLDATDTSTTIKNIIDDLLNDTQSYPSGAVDSITAVSQGLVYDSATVLPIDYSLPTFSAKYEFLDDKLQELDDYGLSYHYVDPDKKFHMYQLGISNTAGPATILFTDDVSDSTSWVSGKVGLISPNSSYKRTLEHHKRRVYGLGGLSAVLDTSNTTTSSNDTLASNYYAGRFTPTKTTLSYITLWLSKVGTPTVDFVMELRDDSASGTSMPTGEVLRSISKNKAFLNGTGTTAAPSVFEMNEELTPGRNYWIVCMINGTDASNCFRWHRDALSTGVSSSSVDDQTWTTDLSGYNYAFQTYLGNEIIQVSKDPNLTASSKHFHEDTLRKSDIVDDKVLKFLLTQENKTAHKKKEIFKCQVYAPDTLLTTGQKVRVRKQASGYLVDAEFTLGQIEYVFEPDVGTFYYECELTRFVDFN